MILEKPGTRELIHVSLLHIVSDLSLSAGVYVHFSIMS